MSSKRTPAQRAAWAKILAARAAKRQAISGRGAYHRKPAAKSVRSHLKGRGAYKKDYGQRLGSVIGEGLQELLTQLGGVSGAKAAMSGFGDYVSSPFHVKENSISMGNDPPEIKNARDGRFIIRHREYLQDIVTGGSGVFSVTSFPIQPGLQESFPWLSLLAQNFEQYRLRGMIFEFKSTSAEALNSTNTALGTVIMATEYDSTKPLFSSKQQMENHQYAASARQSCSMIHPIECARSANVLDELYIRSGAPPANADLRMFDFGNFQIATVGQQASNVNIGELWVTYEVELLKPQELAQGGLLLTSMYVTAGTPTWTNSNCFGASPASSSTWTQIPGSEIAVTIGTNTLTFPHDIGNGVYYFYIQWQGSGAAAYTPPTVTPLAGSGLTFIAGGGSIGGTTTTQVVFYGFVNVSNATNPGTLRTLTFTSQVLPTSPIQLNIYVSAWSGALQLAGSTPYVVPPVSEVLLPPKEEEEEDDDISFEEFKLFMRLQKKMGLLPAPEHKQLEEKVDEDILEKLEEKAEKKEKEDWTPVPDLSQSTMTTLEDIVAKAKAKKLAAAQSKGF